MKKIIFPACLLFILSLFAGCTHYYYAPNSANIPLFKEKNNFQLKAGFGGDDYTGGDIQMAYSAGKNIGIMVNTFFASKTEEVEDNYYTNASHTESGRGSYIEAGVGYYKPFGRHKVWVFETYGGAGLGGENHFYADNETSKLHLTKYFVQPSIGYSSKRGTFEFAISSRFSGLNLKVNQSNVTLQNNHDEQENVNSISLHPSSFLWEPSCIVAAGWPNFKFFLQLTTSANLGNSYLYSDPDNVCFGIKLTFKKDPGSKGNNTNDGYIPPSIY